MTPEEFGERQADAALDREIQMLFAVEPSPQFRAGVRVRIANEPAAAERRHLWWLGAAAMTAALTASVIFTPSRPARQNPTLTGRSIVDLILPESSTPRRLPSDGGVPADAASPFRRAPARPRHTRPAEPEILLAPDETRALRALIAGVHAGRIDLTPVSQATTPDVMELEPIHNLVIAPIAIAPVEGVFP